MYVYVHKCHEECRITNQSGSCTLRPPRLLLRCFPLHRRQISSVHRRKISSDITSSPLSSTATKTYTSEGLAWRLNESPWNSGNYSCLLLPYVTIFLAASSKTLSWMGLFELRIFQVCPAHLPIPVRVQFDSFRNQCSDQHARNKTLFRGLGHIYTWHMFRICKKIGESYPVVKMSSCIPITRAGPLEAPRRELTQFLSKGCPSLSSSKMKLLSA